MDLNEFKDSLGQPSAPDVAVALKSLWHERRGDWTAAHDLLQNDGTSAGAWVHAYLHRKEGDSSNAAYWYRRAGQPVVAAGSFDDEWDRIAESLLSAG